MNDDEIREIYEKRREQWREGLEDGYLALAMLVVAVVALLALARAGVLPQ